MSYDQGQGQGHIWYKKLLNKSIFTIIELNLMIFFLDNKFSGPISQNLICVQTLDIMVVVKVKVKVIWP